jgi:apolipoprotein D and lipocalin family protein
MAPKNYCLNILLFIMIFSGCSTHKPLDTVEKVNLKRYAGKWYEIASFPARFQEGCHCTTAEYIPTDKDYIRVINTCRKGSTNGELDKAEGKAFVVKNSGNAKLKVQFFWPFRGKYWILDLAEDYSWALVGSPSREYLWILSRQPGMEESTYNSIVQVAKEKGFDISKFEMTDQDCGWQIN